MDQTHLLIIAMAEQCRDLIARSQPTGEQLPPELQPAHLKRMCDRIEAKADEWAATRLHRWIGFVQAGMIANGILNLTEARKMFDRAKTAHGELDNDQDLVDHLDPGSTFRLDLGGQG